MKDLKIFAKTIEPQAQAQIDLLLAQKPFEDCKVRIMPDVHAGAGCVIGFTANLGDKVIPNKPHHHWRGLGKSRCDPDREMGNHPEIA